MLYSSWVGMYSKWVDRHAKCEYGGLASFTVTDQTLTNFRSSPEHQGLLSRQIGHQFPIITLTSGIQPLQLCLVTGVYADDSELFSVHKKVGLSKCSTELEESIGRARKLGINEGK